MKNLAKALNGTFSGIAAKLNKNFSPITMREFVNCMEDCFENDHIKVISLLYFLNYVCSSEAKSNNDNDFVESIISDIILLNSSVDFILSSIVVYSIVEYPVVFVTF